MASDPFNTMMTVWYFISLSTSFKSYQDDGRVILKGSVQLFVCVEVLWPSQPNGVMSSAVSLPNHTFTGQA